MAAEFAASATANAVGNVATEYALPYVNYFFHFGRIVEEFNNQRKELELKKGRLKNDVDEAVRQTEVIEKDVKDWLAKADKELREAQGLEDEIERYECFSWCPSLGWRYCLSKKVAKKTLCIKKLVDNCNFQRMGHRPPLQGIEFLPSKGFKASQSSTVVFNAIIKALTTDGVNMIGLYGMPGVGKTTLAKEVGKYAGEQKLFDKVVMVTMSQTPSINKIQDRIAEILGLEFKAKTEEGKAEELWRRLKGTKILIIIDDVWNDFKLETIGIPYDIESEGCKMMLTTRLQQVCIQMNCEEKFELRILLKDEAWALFKENAGLEDFSPTKLIEVAKELAGECQGLPLAIITVAKALKGQSLNAWEAANKRLKDSRHMDNQRVVGNIYSCLGLSYDNLTGNNTKSCFLLCSLFPEDCDISIDWLILIAIGEGLFCNIESMEEQRRETRLALIDLQQSGLLLEINDERDTVRMHDVVRDFAHWLTLAGDTKVMVKDKLTKWSMSENFESHIAIAVCNFNLSCFPDKLEFKKLKTLILSGDGNDLLTIPAKFFEGMKALRVLWLQHMEFSLEALQFLPNVRALLLLDCRLVNKNISSLLNMEKLEILYVKNAYFHELPKEFGRLQDLKYLCFKEYARFPSNFLSRLTSLQELHVLCRNNINLWELSSLSCLTALSLHVSSERIPEGFEFPKLQSYRICVKENPYMRWQALRMLEINGFSSSLRPFKEFFCNVDNLSMYDVLRVRYIVSNEEVRGLSELTSLELVRCEDLEYLIEPTQNLHHHHHHANAITITSLQSLKDVQVKWCRKLKSIFSPCVAHNLLHLQQLSISNCHGLEEVFGFAEYHVQIVEQQQQPVVLSNLNNLELIHLPELRSIWKGSTHLVNLSSLNTLKIQECNKLAYLFSHSLAKTLVHLEHINVESCESLEHLISAEEAENGDAPCWPKLSTLKILCCKGLKDVFSITLAQGLPSLKSIEIVECPQLMGLFNIAKENELPPHLHFLKSESLANFSLGDYFAILPSLVKISVEQYPGFRYYAEKRGGILMDYFNLLYDELYKFEKSICSTKHVYLLKVIFDKNLIPNLKPKELNKLTSLTISNGKGLECLIDMFVQDISDQELLLSNLRELVLASLPELKFFWKGPTRNDSLQSLKVVEIEKCNGLKYVFPSSLAQSLVQLQQLHVAQCDQLEYIILESDSDGEIGPHSEHDLCHFLPHLQDLNLESLMNLSGFSSQNSPLSLSFLNKLRVCYCPRLINFNIKKGVNEQVQLKELSFCDSGYDMINSQLQHNLRNEEYATISEIFQIQDEQLLFRVESIDICRRNQLEGPIQVASLQYLRKLKLWGCNGLKSLFSPLLAQNLPQLTLLEIKYCMELEEIIDSTSASSSSAQSQAEAEGRLPHISFPNLEIIEIIGCNNLKSLFPVSVIPSLSKIKTIKIDGASKLDQVFRYQAELYSNQDDENHKRIVLSSLERFKLLQLSSLRSLAPIGYHFLFPSCDLEIEIEGCPRLTTSFSRDSKRVVHALTQVQPPQYLENDIVSDFMTFEGISSLTILPLYIEEEESESMVLELKKEKLKKDVDGAVRQTEILIEKDVEGWLTRADKELGEAQCFDDEIESGLYGN